jgi:hypothetical protein
LQGLNLNQTKMTGDNYNAMVFRTQDQVKQHRGEKGKSNSSKDHSPR